EAVAFDSVWIGLERERAVLRVRQHEWRDALVVAGQVELGQLRVREHGPIGVGDADLARAHREILGHASRTTSSADLSSLSPRNRGWRSRPSRVHSVNPIWAPSLGLTQETPPPLAARLLVQRLAVAVAVLGPAHVPMKLERALQDSLADAERKSTHVVALEPQDVEHVQEHRDVMLVALGQPGKARPGSLEC